MTAAELPGSTPPATASISDRGCRILGSGLGDVLIFLRRVPTDADRANHFTFDNNGDTTLQWRRPGQSQRRYASVANLVFKHFARPSKNCCRARFANANLNARDLRLVESFQQQQITAVVHNN